MAKKYFWVRLCHWFQMLTRQFLFHWDGQSGNLNWLNCSNMLQSKGVFSFFGGGACEKIAHRLSFLNCLTSLQLPYWWNKVDLVSSFRKWLDFCWFWAPQQQKPERKPQHHWRFCLHMQRPWMAMYCSFANNHAIVFIPVGKSC